jgi:U3 small nucleolar RNA-associated protein 14
MKSLFVTQSKEAMEEFEQEKENEVELQLGNSVAKPDLKQGWGEWAGAGVN